MRTARYAAPLLIALALATACASTANSPNVDSAIAAANKLDKQLYDTLYTAQAAIEQAKVDAPHFPGAPPVVNRAVAAYNTALDAYTEFHNAVATGIAVVDKQTAVEDKVRLLLAELAEIRKLTHHAPPTPGGTP